MADWGGTEVQCLLSAIAVPREKTESPGCGRASSRPFGNPRGLELRHEGRMESGTRKLKARHCKVGDKVVR